MVINIGPAGTGGASEQSFEDLKKADMDAVEIEFTYSIWMTPAQAKKINELNKKLGLKLSIHAQYWINLNSKEEAKIEASKKRILKCCEMGDLVGARYIVFHPAFYSGNTREEAYQKVKEQIIEMQKEIKKNKWDVVLCPETTGKVSQFGDLDELIKLKKETGCHLCVDFAHIKAKNKGIINYDDEVKKLRHLGYIHAHFSGIIWTDRGEKKHALTKDKDIEELLTALKKHKIDCTIINESPDPMGDSIKTKKILQGLK